MLVYLQGAPTWCPENSVNIWNLLSIDDYVVSKLFTGKGGQGEDSYLQSGAWERV